MLTSKYRCCTKLFLRLRKRNIFSTDVSRCSLASGVNISRKRHNLVMIVSNSVILIIIYNWMP